MHVTSQHHKHTLDYMRMTNTISIFQPVPQKMMESVMGLKDENVKMWNIIFFAP